MDMTNTHTTATIHLQGIGLAPAKLAAEIQVGDRLMWNYGYISIVDAIVATSPQFRTLTLRDSRTGNVTSRRMKNDRKVGMA